MGVAGWETLYVKNLYYIRNYTGCPRKLYHHSTAIQKPPEWTEHLGDYQRHVISPEGQDQMFLMFLNISAGTNQKLLSS